MKTKKPTVGRFAPTPSGRLHLGNMYCALIAYLSARAQGGEAILRIEDLDTFRCPMGENTRLVLDDLAWLGFRFTHGEDTSFYQSNRSEIYRAYYDKLCEKGLVYPCFCSRRDLQAAQAPHAGDAASYCPRGCGALSADEVRERMREKSPSFRVRVPEREIAFDDRFCGHCSFDLAHAFGDFIVRRADGVFAYQLAVTVDDALMGVTEVVRGDDLLSSAAAQRYLYETLDLPAPDFCHIPLLTDADGRRLSKRDGDIGLGTLRRAARPEEVIGWLAVSTGLLDRYEPCLPDELATVFDLEKLRTKTVDGTLRLAPMPQSIKDAI